MYVLRNLSQLLNKVDVVKVHNLKYSGNYNCWCTPLHPTFCQWLFQKSTISSKISSMIRRRLPATSAAMTTARGPLRRRWSHASSSWSLVTAPPRLRWPINTVLSGYSDTLGNLNFSRTVAGMTKWFWVTIEGYLSYLLPKFEDLVPTSLGSGEI